LQYTKNQKEVVDVEERERNKLLGKIDEWRRKAILEEDSFNKYISIFIAYNIFYNLYEKTRNPSVDLTNGDSRRAIATLDLVDTTRLFQGLRTDIEDYAAIIPAFREEFWPKKGSRERIAISMALKSALKEENAEMAIEMLLKWLYKVRCNLIHGEKNYDDKIQEKLLAKSSLLLDAILEHMTEAYRKSGES